MKRPSNLASRLARTLRALRDERSGVIGPAVATLGTTLLTAAGLALDVGLYYMGDRELRSATEAAALAAAMNPSQAQALATDYLVKNGYPASVLKSVEIGYYCANAHPAYQPGSRFVTDSRLADCPGSTVRNAVRLATGRTGRRFLTGVLGEASPIPDLAATASAARIDEAGIAVTSDLLRLTSGGITDTLLKSVNGLLGGLIGVTLNLSAPDISALMNGNVDAGRFFDALARRTGHSGTYEELARGTYGIREIALAAADAAYTPATASALSAFGGAATNDYKVPLVNMFGLGVWKKLPIGGSDAQPSLRAGLNAYQLIAFAAQEGTGTLDLSEVVNLAVPGSTVQVAAVANGPMAQPRFSFGPANETSVATSQVRVKLLVGTGTVSVLGSTLTVNSLPVLLDITPASARLTGINCTGHTEQLWNTSVDVWAQSGVVNAYIADVPASAMSKQMLPIGSVNPATLLDADVALRLGSLRVGLVRVTATAKVQLGPLFGGAGSLHFGPGGRGTIGNPTRVGVPVTIGNGSQVGATLGGLIAGVPSGLDARARLLEGALPIGISLQSITAPLLASLQPVVTSPLQGLVTHTVDPLLDNVLAALGVQLGDATVWATGARCGVPVLI